MPGVSPGSSREMLQNILDDPNIQSKLSPEALAAFQAALQQGDVSVRAFVQQAAQTPALKAAFQEAHEKGLLGQSFLDKWGPVVGLGAIAALTLGTSLIPTAGAILPEAAVPVAGGSAVPAASAAVTDLAIPGTVAGPGAAVITGGSLGTLGRVGQIAGALGRGSDAATQAAGQNRINADDTAMQAQRDYENELQSRATTDASQRKSALQDVYRQSFFSTPQNSPYDTRGVTPPSADYLNTLSTLEKQALLRLQNPSPYNMNTVPPLTPYKPKKPSTLEQIGTWASPALSTLSNVAGLF